jgi:hypothetical protein
MYLIKSCWKLKQEGISPNLSFGAPFAMDVNHQHHQLPNQPRMMPNNFMQVLAIKFRRSDKIPQSSLFATI